MSRTPFGSLNPPELTPEERAEILRDIAAGPRLALIIDGERFEQRDPRSGAVVKTGTVKELEGRA